MPYGAGAAYERAYVYGYDNPGRFVDPSGRRGVVSYGLAEGFVTTNGGTASTPPIARDMGDYCRGQEKYNVTRCLESWMASERIDTDEDYGPGSSNDTPALRLAASYGFDKVVETQPRVFVGQIWEGAGSEEVGHLRAKFDEVVVIGTLTGNLDASKTGAPDDGTGLSVNIAVGGKTKRTARRVSFDGLPTFWRRQATHVPIMTSGGPQRNAAFPAGVYDRKLLSSIGRWVTTNERGITVGIAI
jgi:hypothetical protein